VAGPGVGHGVTRRRVPLAELAALPDPRVRAVVDILAAARLLTMSEGHVEVAHEALFREWPLLQSWLAEDVVGRAVARRLALAAAEWDADGREVGALWRGARLAAGLEFAALHAGELTPTEHEFLAAGRERLEAERLEAESRAATTARQNRRLRRLLGGVGLLLVVALVAGVLAVRARGQEEAAKASADARRLAATALTEDYLDRALLDAVEGVREERSPQTLGALFSALARSPAALLQVRTQDRFLRLVGTPDGSTYYATVNNGEVWAVDGRSGAASVWHRYPAPAGVVLSPAGDLLAVGWVAGDEQGAIEVYRRADGARVSQYFSDELIGGDAAWAPDGKSLYLVSADALLVVDPTSGSLVRRVAWQHAPRTFSQLVSLPDGRVVVALGGQLARVVDPRTGNVRTLAGVGPGMAVSPDGRLLAGSRQGAPVLLDVVTWRETRRFPQGATDVFAFSRDGRHLATGGGNETVRLWDLGDPASNEPAEEWAGHSGKLMAAVFAPDGRTLWTAGRDGAVVAWDVDGSRRLATPGRIDPQGIAGTVAADGRTAAVIYDPGPDRPNPARVWDLDTKQAISGLLPDLSGRPGWSTAAVALATDRHTALTGLAPIGDPPREEGVVLVHDLPSGSVRHTVELPFAVIGLDVTPDGRVAIVNGTTGIAFVDLGAGRLVDEPLRQPLYFPGVPGRNVAVSPDGHWAAVARADAVELVDLRSRRAARSWRGPDVSNVLAMAWSPDGRTLAYGTNSGLVDFRSMPDGAQLGPSRLVFPGFTLALAASPDGRWLAGLGTDGELALFDLTARELVGRPLPPPHGGGWGFPAWSTDSTAVTVWYESGDTVRWEVDADRWIDRACQVAHRDLTADEWRLLRPGVPWRATCGPRALDHLPE
jgi:WD40 repeat protein